MVGIPVKPLMNLVGTTDVSSSHARDALFEKFKSKITINPALDRTLVSFQANKHAPFSGWFKYLVQIQRGLF
jgi:hypothetical protein